MNRNVKLIVEKLKKIPFCEGIIYAGSRADGDFTKTSDYDFSMLISKGKSYAQTFRYKGLVVDNFCSTADLINKEDIVRDKIANSELEIFAHGEIVYDKTGKMKALQRKAKKVLALGPRKYTKHDFDEAGYICTNSLHKFSRKKSELAYHSWNEIMDKITKLFFELNHEWMPKSSKREDKIKKIDQKFFKLYKKVYNTTAKVRINATKQLIKYLIKKFNLPQTGETHTLRK